MSEYKGEAGTIYVRHSQDDADDKPYEVWFEDFLILGLGKTETEALKDAAQHASNITRLILRAVDQQPPVAQGANGGD